MWSPPDELERGKGEPEKEKKNIAESQREREWSTQGPELPVGAWTTGAEPFDRIG